ncbi:hypothetical protein L3Q65_17125 [Amycolatopsis sp. FU40]|uniref:hypothetical protein n=1 Tax=Amycolatopsis sp. FU40 TaxID=2914159 RepID=UPI001F28D6E7|nr:hypothetical protein [Amycolatopsis sp. FU40]UKD58375.1 hypothetical protein L3Q65_17125 [Amycolatopsis sp. FU40]
MSVKSSILRRGRLVAGTALAAAAIAGGTIGVAAAATGDRPAAPAAAPVAAAAAQPPAAEQPPEGARATVKVDPNPAAPGGDVTITGNCGGGKGLKKVIGGYPGHQVLKDVKIVDANPDAFKATAKLTTKIGNGVGPVMVDCDGEAGVTLLVTHTPPAGE